MPGAFQLLKGFGPAGGGTPPVSPTLAVTSAGLATITGSTPGTTNTVFSRPYAAGDVEPWTARGSRVGDGTLTLTPMPNPGRYFFYALSTDAGGAAISNLVVTTITGAATSMVLSPKEKLRELLAESGTLQAWFGAPGDIEAVKKRIHFSYFDDPNLRALRPFAVVMWDDFSMVKIAGGDRNYLWTRDSQLMVMIQTNEPNPKDPDEGDRDFEKKIGLVLEEITDLAGLDDRLAVSAVSLEQCPGRPPRDVWADDPHIIGLFSVQYD